MTVRCFITILKSKILFENTFRTELQQYLEMHRKSITWGKTSFKINYSFLLFKIKSLFLQREKKILLFLLHNLCILLFLILWDNNRIQVIKLHIKCLLHENFYCTKNQICSKRGVLNDNGVLTGVLLVGYHCIKIDRSIRIPRIKIPTTFTKGLFLKIIEFEINSDKYSFAPVFRVHFFVI